MMARGRCTFRQQDVTRALRATLAAGIPVQRIEINREGKIIVVIGALNDVGDEARGENEWDQI